MDKSYGDIFHEMITMPNVQWPEVWQAIYECLPNFRPLHVRHSNHFMEDITI
jgi:hypothetical protein